MVTPCGFFQKTETEEFIHTIIFQRQQCSRFAEWWNLETDGISTARLLESDSNHPDTVWTFCASVDVSTKRLRVSIDLTGNRVTWTMISNEAPIPDQPTSLPPTDTARAASVGDCARGNGSALSRLENDPNANPTPLTLQRYAAALGLTLFTSLEQESTSAE